MGAATSFSRKRPPIEIEKPSGHPQPRIGFGLKIDEKFKVLEVEAGGPFDGKVAVNDIITQVQGLGVNGKQVPIEVQHHFGIEGTSFSLGVQRGDQVIENISIIRQIAPVDPVLDNLKRQVDLGFQRRNEENVEVVFKRYAKDTNGVLNIPKKDLLVALNQLDTAVDASVEDLNTMFKRLDRNGDNILDLDEFKAAVQAPTPLEDWARSLPLNQLLADILRAMTAQVQGDSLAAASQLTDEKISLVAEGFKYGLKRVLLSHIAALKQALEMTNLDKGQVSTAKVLSPRMRCGRIEDFYNGLSARIGANRDSIHSALKGWCSPISAGSAGNAHLDFEIAMEIEHCHREGFKFDTKFETPDSIHKFETYPAQEWNIVLGKQNCPQAHMGQNRSIPKLDDLVELDIAKEAMLIRAEVIAVPGPWYCSCTLVVTVQVYDELLSQHIVYNAILRAYPEASFRQFKAANNYYPTTIFVLASALQKLSRVTKASSGMTLYRGLKGTVSLPELFYTTDQHGSTGFTEWGFMSTSSNLNVALDFSGIYNKIQEPPGVGKKQQSEPQDANKLPRVLVINVSSVDRGACVKDFSQYKMELEYLFVPCSFVERAGPSSTSSGAVELIPVKVNSNIKTKTVDELLEQKKDMHVAAFMHHIDQIHRELLTMAENHGATHRLEQDRSAGKRHSVQGFVDRIVEQCKDVLSRHKAVNRIDYVNDRIFRSLVLELIDVKTMAKSKLEEWLQNTSGSFIRFRWNSPLRTVHRRWIAYLSDRLTTSRVASEAASTELGKFAILAPREASVEASVELCKALGLIVESVDEKNDLDETRIMCAAAEGRSEYILRLLAQAGASVNQARPDGVTPIWLAAENGHVNSVCALAALEANVKQPANNGTSPLSIAARNGKTECIKVLAELGASVNEPDRRGSCPLHQAALYGHQETIVILVELGADINMRDHNGFSPWNVASDSDHKKCAEFIQSSISQFDSTSQTLKTQPLNGSKTLIISTGDISDVDGFFALAEYAKTGSDVYFIMNYPAYIGVAETDADPQFADKNPGLGYRYCAKQVFERAPSPAPEGYKRFLDRYETSDDSQRMKCAMTDLAFAMANEVWNEVEGHGTLLFCIGGINAINPFSESAIKNEVLVYTDVISDQVPRLSTLQGTISGPDGQPREVQWEEYESVYMDFNGSLAYWNGYLANVLSDESVVSKIAGVFIMGGVYAEVEPVTMPSIPNVLNRFSSATMNQLYHPQNASDFCAFLAQFNIPVYTVTNNAVHDMTTFSDSVKKVKSFAGVDNFLASNGLEGSFLRQLARSYYESRYNPPRKPYDFYTAFALTQRQNADSANAAHEKKSFFYETDQEARAMAANSCLPSETKTLFYSNVYGITFVSRSDSWEETRAAYTSVVNTQILADDPPFVRSKKEYFRREIEILKSVDYVSSLPVRDLSFRMDEKTKQVSVAP